ncbi:MAG: transcriptional repressor NrdR [Patescibacteria group bacterium]|jgi:transcriptional regulator NrdR family protein|nr:transcriptional repressor NrdR [Patescibacteria group bacterium]
MVCIYCGSETSVSNSRKQKRRNTIWRRRVCDGCHATVTTIESVDLENSLIVIADKHHQPFSRDKLFISIYESCKHRNDAQASATALTDTIIALLYHLITDASVARSDIIKTTVKVLHRFDGPASVHYKAFHPIN